MNGTSPGVGENFTHLPLLIRAVRQTTGPVLELGCGNASTPSLHALLAGTGRNLYSYDNNPDWVERYASLRRPWHVIELVQWHVWNVPCDRFGLVFIDHAPASFRAGELLRFAHRADVIVVHDTEALGYGLEPILGGFRFREDDRRFTPWTTAVSSVRALDLE